MSSGDLENELRQAMAEHVTEVSAPRSLASDAKRRHHRTVRRRAAFAVGAAALVVGVATIPAYHSLRAQPVGADGKERHGNGAHATVTPPAPPRPYAPGGTGSPSAGSTGSRPSHRPRHTHGPHLPSTGAGAVTGLLGYVPAGLVPKPCATDRLGPRETTTCRWTGSGGWIEVRLVHDDGLKAPSDLGLAPPMAQRSTIHDRPALRAVPSQIMWIERRGLGVWVGVSPALSDRLTRVADGVNPP